jgi:hypothetical protein
MAGGCGDCCSVEEKPAVLCAFGESPRHDRRGFVDTARARQRPCKRVEREDIASLFELRPSEIDGLLDVGLPRG